MLKTFEIGSIAAILLTLIFSYLCYRYVDKVFAYALQIPFIESNPFAVSELSALRTKSLSQYTQVLIRGNIGNVVFFLLIIRFLHTAKGIFEYMGNDEHLYHSVMRKS
jgi:hypothetical protein